MLNRVGQYMKQQFAEGKPFRNQVAEIKPVNNVKEAIEGYDAAMTPAAQEMQEALMRLTGKIPLGTGNQSKLAGTLDRAAASPEMLQLLKYLPAGAVGTAGLATAGDLVFEEEDFGNKAMDSLGMGASAAVNYGINRGPNKLGGTTKAGQALATAAMLVGGKSTMDTLQGIF